MSLLQHTHRLILIASLTLSCFPVQSVAQIPPLEQALRLVKEAEDDSTDKNIKEQLKEIRKRLERARDHRKDGNSDRESEEVSTARASLRGIIDSPGKESEAVQEKVAEALRLLQESMVALGEVKATAETEFGLHTATFETAQGAVTVNLPDDLSGGDTISGTVIAEPAGTTPAQQSNNLGELNGYVVEIENQKSSPKEEKSKWLIPVATTAIALILRNKNGKEVSRLPIPVNPKPNDPGRGYQTPSVGQTGRPVEVKGRFDGNSTTTDVLIANKPVRVLAESPRKVVAQSPGDVTGKIPIEVKKQNSPVAKCNFINVGVRLAAGQLNLIRGQTTVMTLTLLGLAGINAPVTVRLVNRSPWVIRMEGGQAQTLVVSPAQLQAGSYTVTRTLTGVRAGGFGINATIQRASVTSNLCV